MIGSDRPPALGHNNAFIEFGKSADLICDAVARVQGNEDTESFNAAAINYARNLVIANYLSYSINYL